MPVQCPRKDSPNFSSSLFSLFSPTFTGLLPPLILSQRKVDGQECVLKEYHLNRHDKSLDPDERRRFLREANVHFKLRHPHIIRILAVVDGKDSSYLSFPRYQCNLDEFMQAKVSPPLPELERLCIAHAVLQAIEYMHAQHIVHVDVKPANIFLNTGHHDVVLGDFDASQDLSHSSATVDISRPMGTILFAAPEVLSNKAS